MKYKYISNKKDIHSLKYNRMLKYFIDNFIGIFILAAICSGVLYLSPSFGNGQAIVVGCSIVTANILTLII